MKKILLLGKDGQLGWELQRSLAPLGEMIALDRHGLPGLAGDLNDPAGLAATIRALQPDILVNAAAFTAVDRAETERDKALRINAESPRVMAETLAESRGLMLHYSTDYVFDGSGDHAWSENDPSAPVNLYGVTKAQGDQAVRDSGCDHLIVRSGWLYGLHGDNFVKTILRLAAERDSLRIVADQFGAPTGAELVADVTAHLLRCVTRQPEQQGTYHLACAGVTSWYEYACFVIDRARELGFGLRVKEIEPILSSSYQTPAVRPLNSRLNTSKLRQQFDVCLPPWQIGVERMLIEFKGYMP